MSMLTPLHASPAVPSALAGPATPARIATRVAPLARLRILPHYFGRYMIVFEHTVYARMSALSRSYGGGHWHFYTFGALDEGFYMAPASERRFRLEVEGNGYRGEMSADAAGIVACLFTYSELSFEASGGPFAELYHRLLGLAGDHAEASDIFRAID